MSHKKLAEGMLFGMHPSYVHIRPDWVCFQSYQSCLAAFWWILMLAQGGFGKAGKCDQGVFLVNSAASNQKPLPVTSKNDQARWLRFEPISDEPRPVEPGSFPEWKQLTIRGEFKTWYVYCNLVNIRLTPPKNPHGFQWLTTTRADIEYTNCTTRNGLMI